MKSFIARHADKITGVLSGFDRLVLRGTLRPLAYVGGFGAFLWRRGVLLKDFGEFVRRTSDRLKLGSLNLADMAGRPHIYLPSARTSKEKIARKILAEDPVDAGLICLLSTVEPCTTFEIHRNRHTKKLELQKKFGKCKHLYHYFIDRRFGFCSARIQTWFPFSIQVCLNGREWLAGQMQRMEIEHVRRENCFPWIESSTRAQKLMNEQLSICWPEALDRIADAIFPSRADILHDPALDYYWSVHQSEWATDLMFETSQDLAAIYPALVRYGITHFSSPDVMRFLGQKVAGAFRGEIVSDFKDRPEGVRVKHRVRRNSIKIYDKEGSVLRVETTINDPRQFKVYRKKQGDEDGAMSWQPMRKGVADLHRRTKVSHAANERYLDALAAADTSTPLGDLLAQVVKPARLGKQRMRPLRLLDPQDLALLQAVNHGEFTVNGFRNRDIAQILLGDPPRDTQARRKRSARITRLLRLLRAHGLIKKIPHTHRYHVTKRGRSIIGALLSVRQVPVNQLDRSAA